MDEEKTLLCEICGEQATHFVRDFQEVFSIGPDCEIEPFGAVHCFCKAHSRDWIVYPISRAKIVSRAIGVRSALN